MVLVKEYDFIWYILLKIEFPGRDGGTHQRVRIHLVSSSEDRVSWWRRWYSSKSTKFICYLVMEIESSGGDGGTHKRVRNSFGIFLWR